jgi:LuxR family maltose regulon positive regulatory protein
MPLLVTKLYVPRPRAEAVARPRLVERLEAGLGRRLTLISAPAGFGKTTLVSEWVAGTGRDVTWLSLDEDDGDPARFLAYLVAAIQTVAPVGQGLGDALNSSQPPSPELALTALVNEIAAFPEHLVLVLDDYHLVDSPIVDSALGFLLDHLPPQLHLVMTTREDPQLPLPRLRARGHLNELRATDLRFTADEAAAFLNDAMGLALSADQVAALEARTEGWIAGLQLAALSMQGRDDVSGFIQRFAGGDRYILDYLVEEVLRRQPAEIRAFLLQTSILDRLTGSLCDAVTGRSDSRIVLETLDRGNLFVVPLDDRREWYRYHHLFAEVLRTHALDDPAQVAVLHDRASEWFEQHGGMEDAVRHAFAAGDHARAADLIELGSAGMQRARREAALLGWLRMLPDDIVRSRPVLSLTYAGVLLSNGELDGVEDHLRNGERWLDEPAGMVVVDHSAFQRLPSWIAIYRAGLSLVLDDVAATVRYAQQALDLMDGDDHLSRGAASALLGLAFLTRGELEPAYRSYADGMAALRRAGNIADTIGGSTTLADIRIAQGRLHESMSVYRDALRVGAEHGPPVLRGTADMYVGMSEILREWNELEAASQHMASSMDLGEAVGFPQHRYRWRVAMARLREAQGDLDGALDLLEDAERLYVGDFHPNVRPVAAFRARVWIAQGRLSEAQAWVRERQLAQDDDLSYLREFEHITLARVILAQHRQSADEAALVAAIGLLDRLLDAAEAGGRVGSLIEILVVRALSQAERGDLTAAHDSLKQALALGEPEGYARIFIDEGPPMALLLGGVASPGTAQEYVARLLAAFNDDQKPVAVMPAPAAVKPAQPLVEPLTERELEVLRLIAEGRSNGEIADRLYLSLSTVKGHNRAIFGKLDVQRRTEAVARARELGLL